MANETGTAQTRSTEWPAGLCGVGVGRRRRGRRLTPRTAGAASDERFWKGRPERVRVPSSKTLGRVALILSTTGHEESGGKPGRPLPKAKYLPRPIVDKYREGKVKSTPGGE